MTGYLMPLILSAAISAILSFYAWRQRTAARGIFAILMLMPVSMRRAAVGLIALAYLLGACRRQAEGLVHPTGVAVAADGSLFIIDHVDSSHSRVVHINPTGEIEGAFQPKSRAAGLVYSGWDIAIGPTGDVFYCNLISNDERVVHDGILDFSPQGKFLSELGAYDYTVDSTVVSHVPYNLDADSAGRVYVSDFNYNELRVFDAQGRLLTAYTKDTVDHFSYQGAGDVVVDDQRNLLYLDDYFAGRLDQYRRTIQADGTPAITYQWSVGVYGHGPHEFSFPQYLALDETTGIVYVGDMGNRRIVAVDPQGNFITQFAPPGVDEWQVLGLAVGDDPSHSGNKIVYAADAFNRVIWSFTPDGQFLQKIEVH